MIRYLLNFKTEFGPLNTIIFKCISNLILYSNEYFLQTKRLLSFFHTNEQPCILFDMDDPFFLMNAHFISTSNTSTPIQSVLVFYRKKRIRTIFCFCEHEWRLKRWIHTLSNEFERPFQWLVVFFFDENFKSIRAA
jgi:hypothetical protein